MKKRTITFFTILCSSLLFLSTTSFAAKVKDKPVQPAEMVVYGKIYTAENSSIAEALAVKDGKFVYVGDKAGAGRYVGHKTRVIDHTGKGLILPGMTEGHGHYFCAMFLRFSPTALMSIEDGPKEMEEKITKTYNKAKATGVKFIQGFGWDIHRMSREGYLDTARIALDRLCPDIPAFIYDAEGHKAIVNTQCLMNAGIIRPDGTCTIKPDTIRGGVIYLDADNMPTGLISEQAVPYTCYNGIDYDALAPVDMYKQSALAAQDFLLSMGYTNALEALATKAGPTGIYKAGKALDDEGLLKMQIMAAYGIDSYNDYKKEIQKAKERQEKYSGTHFHPDYIKLFMDGTCESATGWIKQPYNVKHISDPSHPYGQQIWKQEEVTDITRIANANGLIVHSHVMGDSAVHMAVKAYVDGGKASMRNQLGHVRHVFHSDYLLIKNNNIAVSSGVLWHSQNNHEHEDYALFMPEEYLVNSFPIKSFFDYDIKVSQSTDFPAYADSPFDPFGIMQVAVTGLCIPDPEKGWDFQNYGPNPYQPSELITREQALDMLTINGAWQLGLEEQRGSIKTGKCADFVLVDQDVLTCYPMGISNAKATATFVDGVQVYKKEK